MSIKSNAIFSDVSHREPHQKLHSQLTRNNITLIQTQLTTLQNCIRPIRLGRLIKSLILIILFPCQLLRIKFRSDDLQIMMMRLVLIVRHIDIPIKGSCRFQKSRGSIDQPLLDEIFREGFTKAQVINDVGNIGHVRGQVVTARLGLDVKVSGSAVHEEKAGDHAPRVIFVGP